MRALASPIRRSGRVGRRIPASASVRKVWILFATWRWIDMAGILSRIGQRQTHRGLPRLDQPPDVPGAARVEEDVALPNARLLREQAGVEQGLADGLREPAVVPGEAARE